MRTQVGRLKWHKHAAEDVKSAKVRSGCNLDTAEVGDIPAGALVKVIAEKKAKKGAQRLQIEGYLVTGETALTPLAGWCTKKLFVETSAPDLPPPPSDPTPTAAAAGATEATAEAEATAERVPVEPPADGEDPPAPPHPPAAPAAAAAAASAADIDGAPPPPPLGAESPPPPPPPRVTPTPTPAAAAATQQDDAAIGVPVKAVDAPLAVSSPLAARPPLLAKISMILCCGAMGDVEP